MRHAGGSRNSDSATAAPKHLFANKPVPNEWLWYALIFILSAVVVTVSSLQWIKVYKKYDFDIDNALVDYYAPDSGNRLGPDKNTMKTVVELIFLRQAVKIIVSFGGSRECTDDAPADLEFCSQLAQRHAAYAELEERASDYARANVSVSLFD